MKEELPAQTFLGGNQNLTVGPREKEKIRTDGM